MAAPNRILVPVDFSMCSVAALRYALELGRRLGSTIDILHVWEPPQHFVAEVPVYPPAGPPTTLKALARDAAGREMARMLETVQASPSDRLTSRMEVGNPLEVILASSRDYDLVVMGTHGRSGLAHLLLGSVAEQVVRRAPCPVLTVRAPQVDAPPRLAHPSAPSP